MLNTTYVEVSFPQFGGDWLILSCFYARSHQSALGDGTTAKTRSPSAPQAATERSISHAATPDAYQASDGGDSGDIVILSCDRGVVFLCRKWICKVDVISFNWKN